MQPGDAMDSEHRVRIGIKEGAPMLLKFVTQVAARFGVARSKQCLKPSDTGRATDTVVRHPS
jgi:hypothetical protein